MGKVEWRFVKVTSQKPRTKKQKGGAGGVGGAGGKTGAAVAAAVAVERRGLRQRLRRERRANVEENEGEKKPKENRRTEEQENRRTEGLAIDKTKRDPTRKGEKKKIRLMKDERRRKGKWS